MIPFQQLVAAAHVQSAESHSGGGEWNVVGEGKYLSSLSPSGFDILDERSGLGTARAVQPFRSYLFDGANDAIEWTTADIGTLYASWYDVTNKAWDSGTIAHGSGTYSFSPGGNVAISNLKIWTDDQSTTEQDQAFELSSIPANLWFWCKCDDIHDTVAYDSNGGANNGTKTSITTGTGPGTFHAEGGTGWLPDSWQNRVGYSDSANGPVPRDESDTANDVLGDPLDYVGPVPRNAVAVNSNCVELDGVSSKIQFDAAITLPVDGASTWSVEFRCRNDSVGDMLFGKGGTTNNRFYFWGGGYVRVHLESSQYFDLLYDVADDIGEWIHGLLAYNGSSFTLVVDGVDRPYVAGTWAGGNTSLVVDNIGNPYSGNTFAFDGPVSGFRITLDGTVVMDLPLSEGAGTRHYNRSGSNHATPMNTGGGYHITDSNARPSNLLDGYSLYEHATLDPIRVPYGIDGNPLTITPPTGYTKTSDHPAGVFHNGAEAKINFKPEPDASYVHQIEADSGESIPDQYSHGDALPSFMTKVTDANGNESQFMINEVE